MKLSFIWLILYVTFLMPGELHWWQKLFIVQSWLQYVGQLLIISSDVNIRGLKKAMEKSKGKAIPLQAWTGLEGSRRLRLPDFKTIGT